MLIVPRYPGYLLAGVPRVIRHHFNNIDFLAASGLREALVAADPFENCSRNP